MSLSVYGFFKDDKLVYVGQTRMKVESRIWKHYNCAKLKKDLGMPILRAIIKYGKDSFTWKVLKTCKTLEEMNIVEIRLIKKHNPRYNIALGGVKGLGHSKETRKKISEIQKKRILCVDDQICFFSVQDAEAFYKAGKNTIGRAASGKRNSYRGKKFRFINKVPKDKCAGTNKEKSYR